MIWIEFAIILATFFLSIDNRVFFYWPFYCAGILCSGKIVINKINYIIMLISILLFVFISVNAGNEIGKLSFISAGCFIIFLLNLGRLLEKTFLLEIMTKLSYASMCAYLFHRPFYSCIIKLTGRFSIVRAYIMVLPLLFLFCYGAQYLYDKLIKNRIDIEFLENLILRSGAHRC